MVSINVPREINNWLLVETKDVNEWIIVSHDQKEMWKNILVKVNKQDIHVMNKRALGRVIPDLMEAFDAN